MLNEQEIIEKLKNGATVKSLVQEYHVGLQKIQLIRDNNNLKRKTLLQQALEYPGFMEYFKDIYKNNDRKIVLQLLSKHDFCINFSKDAVRHLFDNLRSHLDLPLKMPQTNTIINMIVSEGI